MELRLEGTHYPLRTLGPGKRLGIWFQGCSLACPGCMSRHTWDPGAGTTATVREVLALWRRALADGADGLTVSGGEPLQQTAALRRLLAAAARLRDATRRRVGSAGSRPADLLVYTGYEPGELTPARRAALAGADAVITGRFRVAEPTRLAWRGSANQRIVPLTPLGALRYAPHLDGEQTGGRLQTACGEDGGLRLYGVPLRGELAELERQLKQSGVALTERSWRP
ncbi:4Fe-4S single cluster domain-containing protein [Streptomyces sp. FXJ1.172]|uniref:4Fe-4S single cluster domain-containing protein n=1 Tax=Streptomyces sp. FXJ1.172 TaxID=710705 RepID=UPI0007CF0DF3|nr:4Fe-4S single cluster domain-containing protein [Streptomyces sp. FXJ1.172]WEO94400.1 4Fe-4S single cluster domain-containing protein [Streptomyces sp. FXJ1.172]